MTILADSRLKSLPRQGDRMVDSKTQRPLAHLAFPGCPRLVGNDYQPGGPVFLLVELKRDEVIVLRCGVAHDQDSLNNRGVEIRGLNEGDRACSPGARCDGSSGF
jgi:hypothetical protein